MEISEIKDDFMLNQQELKKYNEIKLMEFKELFLTTDMPVDEIYSKIGVTKNSPTFRFINAHRKQQGLSAKTREVTFTVKETSSEGRVAELEELYQSFKEIYVNNPKIAKKEVYAKLGETQTKEKIRYINQRLNEENIPNHYNTHPGFHDMPDEKRADDIYQEYKKLFQTTDIPLKKIREQLRIPDNVNAPFRKYITERSQEDGLDGRKRRINKARKNNPKVVKSPKKKKTKPATVSSKNLISNNALENSKELLNKFFQERNIKTSTQKGYIASMGRWFNYVDYNDLQENIDTYIKEEDNRIPTRDRRIKKEMLGFREHLINDKNIKSAKSVRSYFSKVGTVFRHFGLEIPSLPQVKMDKGYVSNYNDLPTHEMLRNACEQSPIDLKAIILFMSSSGSAKAETLSITVGMFLEGCADYLEEIPTEQNIPETIKALSDKHDIVPLIYLRRIKTDKWYYTCCSPEASYMIIESLKIRKNLQWNDKLFDYTQSLLLTKFQEINDNNNWGYVGAYRRFRSHALRKFMASNIGLPRDQVDSFQGRAKDMIQEAYFKQDPQSLKKIYMNNMNRIMIYDNWGHGTTPEELEQKAKRLFNDFNDDVKILDLSTIPATPEEIKTSIGIEEEPHHVDRNTQNVNQNSLNSMPVTAPIEVPVGTVAGSLSISEELLNYAKLMDIGLISIAEFNRIKQKLLGALLILKTSKRYRLIMGEFHDEVHVKDDLANEKVPNYPVDLFNEYETKCEVMEKKLNELGYRLMHFVHEDAHENEEWVVFKSLMEKGCDFELIGRLIR